MKGGSRDRYLEGPGGLASPGPSATRLVVKICVGRQLVSEIGVRLCRVAGAMLW